MASEAPEGPTPQNSLAAEVTPATNLVPKVETEVAPVTAEDLEAEFGGGDPPAPAGQDPAAVPGSEGEEGAGAPQDPPAKQQTAEERIAELVAEKHEEKRLREAAEAEVTRLKPPVKEPETAKVPDPEAAPDPANYEFGEADTKFIADNAVFQAKNAVREEFAAREAAATQTAQVKELETKQETIFTAGKEKYPDFEEKVIKGAETKAFPCGKVATLAVLHSPIGQEIAYYLATNVDDAKRIDALSPLEQAREMGKIEARLEAKLPSQAAPVRTTAAPAPPLHRARGEGGKFAVPDDTDDFLAFEAAADARMKK